MPRMPRPCMCHLHKGALVPNWKFRAHLAMILKGTLALWAPVDPNPVVLDDAVIEAVEGAEE